jgi:hypothetical protein
MAEFSLVPANRAPRPPARRSPLADRMATYERYVEGVKKGQVGKLVPDEDETARGVSRRIARAGTRINRNVRTWIADEVVYFSVE